MELHLRMNAAVLVAARECKRTSACGIKPLVEVILIEVLLFNKPQMVDISLQGLHHLSDMENMMYG